MKLYLALIISLLLSSMVLAGTNKDTFFLEYKPIYKDYRIYKEDSCILSMDHKLLIGEIKFIQENKYYSCNNDKHF